MSIAKNAAADADPPAQEAVALVEEAVSTLLQAVVVLEALLVIAVT